MTEPTDAELIAELEAAGVEFMAFRGGLCGTKEVWVTAGSQDAKKIAQGVRAVLAKWGTLRAEKIVIPTDTMEQEFQKHYRLGYEAGKKAATPQPTQALAVNQADRPFIVRLAEDFAEECVTAGYVTTKAASYGRLMNEVLSSQSQAGAELAEADRRAGAAERELASCHEDVARFTRARDQMKKQWGVDRNVSFDVVWDEALRLKQQAGAVPLDEARRLFDAGWKAAALFCEREDVVADGIIGFGACPQFEAAFSAANGIKGGQHGTE